MGQNNIHARRRCQLGVFGDLVVALSAGVEFGVVEDEGGDAAQGAEALEGLQGFAGSPAVV